MLKEQLKYRISKSSSVARPGSRSEDRSPSPGYNLMSEKLRRSSSGAVQCSLFCGGQNCKYETPSHWGVEDQAMKGLYSHWVMDRILAMARPSTFLFSEYALIGQFKSFGVCSVINLQCPWEHSKCGPGLESSGFSYQPQDLMKEGVFYYNFSWSDYSVPSLSFLLDAVKVLDFAVTQGKAAVHCHAGLGRTGVLIACHMIYSERIPGNQAITWVRAKRPGSIQTRSQIGIVQNFAVHLSTLWTFHPTLNLHGDTSSETVECAANEGSKVTVTDSAGDSEVSESGLSDHSASDSAVSLLCMAECLPRGNERLSFNALIQNQNELLHGQLQKDLKHIPKVVNDVCARIRAESSSPSCDVILDHTASEKCRLNPILSDCLRVCCYDNYLDPHLQPTLDAIKNEMNSGLDWALLRREEDLRVLLSLLSTFFSSLKTPFLAPRDVALLDTSKLTSLPPPHFTTITHLLSTFSTLVTQNLRCNRRECLVSIMKAVCRKLSDLSIQCDESCGLQDYPLIVARVLVEHALTSKPRVYSTS